MTPTPNPPAVVCFDWGGVILRIARSFEEGCRLAGVELRAKPEDPALYEQRRELVRLYQSGQIEPGAYYERTSAAFDGVWSPEEIRSISDAWLVAEYDGVSELARELADRDGLTTCLLSNTCHDHYVRGGLGAEFETIGHLHRRFASHEIGAMKPEESIYRHVESELGVTGDAVLFFDDTPENIETAQGLGWRAFRVDPNGDTNQQMRTILADQGVL